MKVTAQINQGHPIALSHSVLRALISFLDDEPENQGFFDEAALHSSSQIRTEVASKLHLSAATYERLAVDPSIEVVKNIVTNSSAWKVVSVDVFKAMIRRDVGVVFELLPWGLGEMRPDLRSEVLVEIMQYDDPFILDFVLNQDF